MLTMDCDAEALDSESKVSGSRLSHLSECTLRILRWYRGRERRGAAALSKLSSSRDSLLGMGESRTMSGAQRTHRPSTRIQNFARTGEYLAEGRTLPLRGLARAKQSWLTGNLIATFTPKAPAAAGAER